MAHEPDVFLLMTTSASLDIFLNTTITNETFFVIFHLPDYKPISNTMQHQKSHYQ